MRGLISKPSRHDLALLSGILSNDLQPVDTMTKALHYAEKVLTDTLLLYKDVWYSNEVRAAGDRRCNMQGDIVQLLSDGVLWGILRWKDRCVSLILELVRLRLGVECADGEARERMQRLERELLRGLWRPVAFGRL